MNKPFLISLLMIFIVACTPQNSVPTAIPMSSPISFTPTITLSPIETSTPESVPTLTTVSAFPDQNLDQILDSPNGEFIAKLENAYSHPAFEPQLIKILDKNGSLLWKIPYQHETAMVDPHPGLTIYGWSKDSAYLYFYYDFSPDGGDFAFWWDGFDLQRINVDNGETEQVIPSEPKKFVAFAFSPDETQIAYTREQDNPSLLYIRNLATGAETTIEVTSSSKNYVRVGDIHWSPSGKEIAFQTETDDFMAQTIVLNPATMEQKMLREYIVSTSYFQGWSDDGNLEFANIGSGVSVVHVNPENGETTVVGTPTPQP